MSKAMAAGSLDGEFNKSIQVTVSGQIRMIVPKTWGRVIYLEDVNILWEDKGYSVENILIYSSEEQEFRIGNKIAASGKLYHFTKSSNPGQFDEYMYYKAQGIGYKLRADRIWIENGEYSLIQEALRRWKDGMSEIFIRILPPKEAGTIIAMVLGEKHLLDQELNELYQENGIAHVIAISGLHISMIGSVLYLLLKGLGMGMLPSGLISIIAVYAYGILTGMSVSAHRAVVMFFIMMLGSLLGRSYDMLSSLAFSAILILIKYPLQLFSAGFLLSFGAVLGLGIFLPAFQKLFPGRNSILSAVFASISAQLPTLPVLMLFFYQIPLYSLLINLLILPTSSLLILSALCAGILGGIHSVPGIFLAGTTHHILKFYEMLCRVGTGLPGYLYTTGTISGIKLAAFILLLSFFLWNVRRIPRKIWTVFPVLAVIILLIPVREKDLIITMLDVGQGDGIYIRTPTGTNYLIDGGSSDRNGAGRNLIQPYLLYRGTDHIDYALVSHCDEDHINGLKELIKGRKITIRTLILPGIQISTNEGGLKEKIQAPYLELIALAEEEGIEIRFLNAGDIIRDGEVQMECLHPAKEYPYSTANSYSMVLNLTYKNFEMLFTGDLDQQGEQMILPLVKDVDVLNKRVTRLIQFRFPCSSL